MIIRLAKHVLTRTLSNKPPQMVTLVNIYKGFRTVAGINWASLVVQMVNESTCNPGDQDLIPGSGRSPGEGNFDPLQSSCWENPMDRGAWQTIVQGVAKNQTQLSN